MFVVPAGAKASRIAREAMPQLSAALVANVMSPCTIPVLRYVLVLAIRDARVWLCEREWLTWLM